MNNFAPSTYFSMENHNADASLMRGDMMVTMMVTDDGDDDKFHQHVINTQKVLGNAHCLVCKFS